MEASFRSRLDRTFGFLNDARNDGDTHLWSVERRAASMKNKRLSHGEREGDSDDDEVSGYADFLKSEIAKRRDSQGERLKSSFFGEEDLEELESGDEDEDEDDDDEEEQMRAVKKKKEGVEKTEIEEVDRPSDGGGGGDGPLEPSEREDADEDEEEREVREMVGMDDTLDFEDEEDEYDKVAVGTEGFDDRLFMSQVRNFGTSRQQLNPLPTSFIEMRQASRDRRANHKAALARLEEDDREAATRAAKELSQATENFETEKLNTAEEPNPAGSQPVRHEANGDDAMDIDGDGHKEESMEEVRNEMRQSVRGNLESSLAREGKQRKPGKRVRFSVDETAGAKSDSVVLEPSTVIITSDGHSTPNRYSKVPDYVKNPSKYIHYTLDWSEEDEEQANMAAFHAARVVSSASTSTQDMVTDKHEKAVLESQGPSGSTKISFNPLVKRSSKVSGSGVGREGLLTSGVVNVAANFDMDSNLGGLITMEDDHDFSTSSDSVGHGKSVGRVVRRYRNRVTDDIETD